MPYRVRPLDWSLLVNPSMAGIEMELRGSENLARGIGGGLSAIGEGIVRGRQEKESKRRFDIDTGFRQKDDERADAALALQYEEHLERQRERQSNDTAMLDQLTMLSDGLTTGAAETGQVDPKAASAVSTLTDALGGPRVVLDRYMERALGAGRPSKPP